MKKGTKKQVGISDEELKAKVGVALEKKPASLTELGRLLGWKKISGSQSKRIRSLIPGIEETLKKNVAPKAQEAPEKKPVEKPAKSAKSKVAAAKKPGKAAGNHVEGNPYRPGSNYALVFDCLSKRGKDQPVSRKELATEVCKLSGKSEKLVSYDFSVVLSPKKDEAAGHRNARNAAKVYWVEKLDGGLVQLHLR
jgi:hypothetical protein